MTRPRLDVQLANYHRCMRQRILVVEDEAGISEPLLDHLTREGFDAEVAGSLEEARTAYDRTTPDVILLDVMLPDGDGRDLAGRSGPPPTSRSSCSPRAAKRSTRSSASSSAQTTTSSSRSVPRELVARIRAIMRRGAGTSRLGPITVGAITLDPGVADSHEGRRTDRARREGVRPAPLLMANAGTCCGARTIMDEVWDPHWFGPTKTLDVHISWLRKKIEDDPTHPRTSPRSAASASGSSLADQTMRRQAHEACARGSSWPSPTSSLR